MASKKKNKTITEKLFGRFSKKKSKKNIQDTKDVKKNGKVKSDRPKFTKSNQNSKTHKIIDVTPASPTELKDTYTIDDVINYRSQLIRSVSDAKRKTLVTEKLRLCSVRFDFSQIIDDVKANMNVEQQPNTKKKLIDGIDFHRLSMSRRPSRALSKEEKFRKDQIRIGIDKKRQMLVEIAEYISSHKWWDEEILKELIDCVRSNLFRTLPFRSNRKSVKGDDDEEPFIDPQWLHLQLVYELCLRFLISNDIDKKVMQTYLHGSFVLNLIHLFESEDVRERDYLKTILHRIYGRFMPLRQQIRTEIANECYRYVYGETRGVHGIAEFLDIFSSIINGFSIPVKEEHKAFLRNVLLPLHKCNKYEVYFQQLADCCVLFVNKDQTIATTVLAGLLKFWPKTTPTKQALYLREMLNVIGALVEHENGFSYPKYKDIVLLCVNKIFTSMESSHFQVADQALSLWKDTVMLYLSKCQKDMIWRRLFIIFKDIELNHWNPGIKQLTSEVVQYYERIDFQYWQKLNKEYEESCQATQETTTGEREMNGHASNGHIQKTAVIVPDTLVPNKYQTKKKANHEEKVKARVSKWQKIRDAAEQNKKLMSNDNAGVNEKIADNERIDTEEIETPLTQENTDTDLVNYTETTNENKENENTNETEKGNENSKGTSEQT